MRRKFPLLAGYPLPVTSPRTFWIQTLGCRTNGADSDRIVRLLAARGLTQVPDPSVADLRVVNTCSVTTAAASQSRQAARKVTQLPVLGQSTSHAGRVIVTGCWATSNTPDATAIAGVDAVITHHQPVEQTLQALLDQWGVPRRRVTLPVWCQVERAPIGRARQRAYLKVQDGCDAHCTYCIIPKLRPKLWSIDPADAVAEVRRLVDEGHREVVLTGIFLGATGQPTALRRRQATPGGHYLAGLVRRIAADVPELTRLRLSSLEPGDLTDELLAALRDSPQVVPHFHLPLQSGSDAILRRMNRQYGRADFLALVDRLRTAFDRPALTTDVLVGFPGETDQDFADTLSAVDHAGFLHIHAFPFSPRPGTAAARWTKQFVPGPIVRDRMNVLRERSSEHNLAFRRQFVGEVVQIIVESGHSPSGHPHGRCERYFDVEMPCHPAGHGTMLAVRITEVSPSRTTGHPL